MKLSAAPSAMCKRRFLIILWILQVLAAFAVVIAAILVYLHWNTEDARNAYGKATGFEDEKRKGHIIAIYMVVSEAVVLALIGLDIVLYARQGLRPAILLGLNTIECVVSVPVWVLGILVACWSEYRLAIVISAVVSLVSALSYLCILSYAGVVTRRSGPSSRDEDDLSQEFGLLGASSKPSTSQYTFLADASPDPIASEDERRGRFSFESSVDFPVSSRPNPYDNWRRDMSRSRSRKGGHQRSSSSRTIDLRNEIPLDNLSRGDSPATVSSRSTTPVIDLHGIAAVRDDVFEDQAPEATRRPPTRSDTPTIEISITDSPISDVTLGLDTVLLPAHSLTNQRGRTPINARSSTFPLRRLQSRSSTLSIPTKSPRRSHKKASSTSSIYRKVHEPAQREDVPTTPAEIRRFFAEAERHRPLRRMTDVDMHLGSVRAASTAK